MEGSVSRLVHCEQCGLEYVYTVERAACGVATDLLFGHATAAEARASQEARQALQTELQYATDPVPCPSCGHYQARMVAQLKRYHRQGMVPYGIALSVLSPFLLLGALFVTVIARSEQELGARILIGALWVVTLALAAAGPVLLLLHRRSVRLYDPNNEEVEARKQLGKRLALPKDEYQKIIREMRKKHMI